jgi:hypothetical protein
MRSIAAIRIACACALLLSVVGLRALAGDDKQEHPKAPANPSFEALRALEGTWESDKPGQDGKPNQIIFHVMAAGSIVAETMFPGSAHEMLNTYHMDGDMLMVTHYCAQGVQPRMKMVSNENGTMKFEFFEGTNLKGHESEGHMGALELTIKGDKLSETWGFLKDGKVSGQTTFELHRKNG